MSYIDITNKIISVACRRNNINGRSQADPNNKDDATSSSSLYAMPNIYILDPHSITVVSNKRSYVKYNEMKLPKKIETGASNMRPTFAGTNFLPKGIYLNADTASCDDVFDYVNTLNRNNCNTLIFDVKNCDGYIRYSTSIPMALTNKIVAPSIPLKKLIYHLKKENIHSIVRQSVFFDVILAKKRPDLKVKHSFDPEPEELKCWVDPKNEEVIRYNLDIAAELAKAGIDEINFDYVRFPSFINLSENGDRTKIICEFLRRARGLLKPYGVKISVDVFAVTAWKDNDPTIKIIGQDLKKIAQYVDYVYIMAYPSHFYNIPGMDNPADQPYKIIDRTCKYVKELFKDLNAKPVLFLQAFKDRNVEFPFGPDYIKEQLRALKDNGMEGYLFWNSWNHYDSVFNALTSIQRSGNTNSNSIIK